jgi:arabinogalactan endo-1,4-beta-galactosidase
MRYAIFAFAFLFFQCKSDTQNPAPTPVNPFYRGADLSYTNEMEDCGVVYRENGAAKDPYKIFADNGCNLVRLRLWHTPSWHDTLNSGKRYSDFNDVRRSIRRAKDLGMQVLLDFHLSDTWADPQRQLAPKAWLPVINNLPALKDSVYNYVLQTLTRLDADGLLPEMVQIGNETNRPIILSPAVDAGNPSIDWSRNAALFNAGIKAARDVEKSSGKKIKVALHIAGPANAEYFVSQFRSAGVTDFDVLGLSYYWAWHRPTTIAETGAVISRLRATYPKTDVMIFETGYIWTLQYNDAANNIIDVLHPNYSPASPENQRKWLVDLSAEVKKQGGIGVVYWEPSWVSSPCRNQWSQGSNQENATFFDFENNVLPAGGMGWLKGE